MIHNDLTEAKGATEKQNRVRKMTNLEIAQMIANEIDTKSQEQIDAMLEIVCKIHSIDMSWLFPVVGNLYAKMSKSKTVGHKVSSEYSEAEAR